MHLLASHREFLFSSFSFFCVFKPPFYYAWHGNRTCKLILKFGELKKKKTEPKGLRERQSSKCWRMCSPLLCDIITHELLIKFLFNLWKIIWLQSKDQRQSEQFCFAGNMNNRIFINKCNICTDLWQSSFMLQILKAFRLLIFTYAYNIIQCNTINSQSAVDCLKNNELLLSRLIILCF